MKHKTYYLVEHPVRRISMHTSRNVLIGLIIILIGLSALFRTLGINIHLGIFIGPLIFFVLGLIFYRKNKRILSLIFFAIGLIALFDNVFHINIVGVLIAIAFIYFGYRLLTGTKKDPVEELKEEPIPVSEPEIIPSFTKKEESRENPLRDEESGKKEEERTYQKKVVTSPSFRSSFIGDYTLLGERFELKDMNIRNGIGDIKIDLSKGIIPEGETVIIINGVIGDIDIYIPYDLDVSVQAVVTIGELNVLENRQSGINRNIFIETKEYKQSSRRVKLVLSLFIGDIDVRYV